MMFNGFLLVMLFMWTSADIEPSGQLQDQEYENERNVTIQQRTKKCTELGGGHGKCEKRNCPNGWKSKPKGEPYCSEKRRCCYPDDISDAKIKKFTEKLMSIDMDNYNYDYNADLFPLLIKKFFVGETIEALVELQKVFIASVQEDEIYDGKRTEIQKKFLDAIMKTKIMEETEWFLKKTRPPLIHKPLREVLEVMWFHPYSRSEPRGKSSSSGFEHVFAGEVKLNSPGGTAVRTVIGLHNWIFYFSQHIKGNMKLNKIKKTETLSNQRKLLDVKFKWKSYIPKSSSIFFGASPELEMAVYTLCFLARPQIPDVGGEDCKVKMAGKLFKIGTLPIRGDNRLGNSPPAKELLGTAHPILN